MASPAQKSGSSRTKPASRARSGASSRARAAPPQPPPAPPPSTASKLRGPALAGGAALAGILGGIALGAKARPKRRFPNVNGFDLKHLDVKKTRKQVGRASKQFGELTRELRKAGEQAERIGDALS